MKTPPDFNPERKFIRIMKTHANGLIEFEFAVGEPELFVELLMAQSAFDEFCVMHQVTPTQGPLTQAQDGDNEEWDWSLRAAREQQIRHGSNKA
ncbi:MAG: phenol hydroxylase subunit [Rhodoferax sp.]|nr:phenol hydroxylase subunit [Rhodoferax sp.]MCF8207996.1 phenol hydroxylase subunit [Rhodoferax sp.]